MLKMGAETHNQLSALENQAVRSKEQVNAIGARFDSLPAINPESDVLPLVSSEEGQGNSVKHLGTDGEREALDRIEEKVQEIIANTNKSLLFINIKLKSQIQDLEKRFGSRIAGLESRMRDAELLHRQDESVT